ncbi:MAG: TIGR01212 family radical SAM protein [Lachnospiraceae bacterium]|nr:TIGR01212 family radical SAM protein [Lachnospiraceae bacterium]
MKYKSLNSYLKEKYGRKIYKIAINAGFTCPNRDGSLDNRGCIFCSGEGSGEFAGSRTQSITEQIESGKKRILSKMPADISGPSFIAYFQAFTNTYAPVEVLREKYTEAINHPDIAILSIATRPDCLEKNVLSLLDEMNHIKPVWVELGLQTIHKESADYIRRGYDLNVYEEAVRNLRNINIEVITHVILGLPGETRDQMLHTVDYVGKSKVQGIKLQLLHVIRGTDLEKEYNAGKFECMTLDEYVNLIYDCLKILPDDMVIHRMTGDGDKRTLVAPMWSANKKNVLNTLNRRIAE